MFKVDLSCFSRIAQASPAGPAPTIATSYSMTSRGDSLIEWPPKNWAIVDHKPELPGGRPPGGQTSEGIFVVVSLYSMGTPMLTGHGRRLPGWPMDLGMDWARTPTPLCTAGRDDYRPGRTAGDQSCRQLALRLAKYAEKPSRASAWTRNRASRAAAPADAAARSGADVCAISRISALASAKARGAPLSSASAMRAQVASSRPAGTTSWTSPSSLRVAAVSVSADKK